MDEGSTAGTSVSDLRFLEVEVEVDVEALLRPGVLSSGFCLRI